MKIDLCLVKQLIDEQYPMYSNLDVKMVEHSGHDNRTFHLGNHMTIRLPSHKKYASQIEKEASYLPILQKGISLPIQKPLHIGKGTSYYPYPWSINEWLDGASASYERISDLNQFAMDLAHFLLELQSIDCSRGPKAGEHNFYSGGSLEVYKQDVYNTRHVFEGIFDTNRLLDIWEEALGAYDPSISVFVHGDIAVGNLLVKDGCLSAVIDFGILGTGDPSCDYVIAWTFLNASARKYFFEVLNCDEKTMKRAKGWALWKAMISYDPNDPESQLSKWALFCINELII